MPRATSVNATMAAPRRSARISTKILQDASTALNLPSEDTKPPAISKNKRKKAADTENEPAAPKTPTKKRVKQYALSQPPPVTPIQLTGSTKIAADDVTGKSASVNKATKTESSNKVVKRLADPKLTNVALRSPESSRVVASRDLESISPTKAPAIKTTTENLLIEACEHLIKVDERMRPLIKKHHCHVFSPEGLAETIDPFENLCGGIMSQQVSGAAAKSIKAKFVALFTDKYPVGSFPPPSEVAKCSIEHLRTAGLSQRKAEYIQGLAEKFASGELTAQMLHDAPYEELMEKLIAVRGLGKWSVEMFAFFGLRRMDVFSLGDLGVQRGCAAFVGRDVAKLKNKGGKWKYMSEKDMLELSDKFAPYRSLFMWYMWRVEPTDVSTME